jgi:hypothetical protein
VRLLAANGVEESLDARVIVDVPGAIVVVTS